MSAASSTPSIGQSYTSTATITPDAEQDHAVAIGRPAEAGDITADSMWIQATTQITPGQHERPWIEK